MPDVLRCVSVHSVKGGVGKSSIAYLLARRYAERGDQTLLVDMDLTGTSLADVLPLRAPVGCDLNRAPTAWRSVSESRRSVEEERASQDGWGPAFVPFLNDYLLATGQDVHPMAVVWESDVPGLLVAPSSALPRDLVAILPVIYDEPNAGFLESRIEWFLDQVIARTEIRHVVFDSPPTIPGLSRALLSLAMRLPNRVHLAPSESLDSPPRLFAEDTTVRWAPLLLVSPDHQDLRAADRWLNNRGQDEVERILVVVNLRDFDSPEPYFLNLLRNALVDYIEPEGPDSDTGNTGPPRDGGPGSTRGGPTALPDTGYTGRLLEEGRVITLERRPAFRLWRPRSRPERTVPIGFEELSSRVDQVLG